MTDFPATPNPPSREPQQSHEESSKDLILCAECDELSFDEIFAHADEWVAGAPWLSQDCLFITSLSSRFARMKDTKCSVCQFFWACRVFDDTAVSLDYELVADYMYERQADVFLMVRPIGWQTSRSPSYESSRYSYNCIFRGSNGVGVTDRIWGREVPPSINYSLLHEWIKICQQDHLGCAIYKSARSGESWGGFRLLDCESSTVVSANGSEKYAALSYVWGTQRSECSREEQTTWPKVILDAAEVVKGLGLRYLWVDQCCISQDDTQQKYEQISKMDLIYEHAEITIVATTGQSSHAGLTGVKHSCRPAQPKLHIGKYLLISTMKHPQHIIQQSKWFTRAWTYQEAVISQRLLIFTDQQVYFECASMNCYESLRLPITASRLIRDHKQVCLNKGLFDLILKQSMYDSLALYKTHLELYSLRELKFESDSLNAFRGIMSRLFTKSCTPDTAQTSILGLPVITHKEYRSNLSFIVSLVSWKHEGARKSGKGKNWPPKRRPQFPSWSWAGWEGSISCSSLMSWGSLATIGAEYYATLQIELLDGRLVSDIHSSDALLAIGDHKDQVSQSLIICNPILLDRAEFNKRNWHEGDLSRAIPFLGDHDFSSVIFADGVYFKVYMSKDPTDIQSFFDFVSTGHWKCVLMMSDGGYGRTFLLLEKAGAAWERVGLLNENLDYGSSYECTFLPTLQYPESICIR